MRKWLVEPDFIVERDLQKCIACQVCVRQCANDVHEYDPDEELVLSDSMSCVGCHRCATLCPTHALSIRPSPLEFRANANWSADVIRNVYRQAETGGVLLSAMGNDRPFPVYWDHMLLNASQVTNPSIDPLREPMELLTYLGRKPDTVRIGGSHDKPRLETAIQPQLELKTPIMFSAMSYGSISYSKVVLKHDRVVGAIFVGRIDRAGIITGLIKEGISVASFKDLLLTDSFGLISLPSEYRKHVVSGTGIEL